MKPQELLAYTKSKTQSAQETEFWKIIEELERTSFSSTVLGRIEKNVHIEGTLFLGKDALIKSGTRIEGNAFIGRNSVIGPNALLRKNVVIGENCRVSSSEIKNSVILDNSNIPHYSYVGDSVVCERVNFGAGAKVANLRFDNKNVHVSINGKKIDSGRRKLGALVNADSRLGINACINCGIIIGKKCFVFPGAIVRENLPSGTIKER